MVIGTCVSLLLVDRVGRRPLLIEGGLQARHMDCRARRRAYLPPSCVLTSGCSVLLACVATVSLGRAVVIAGKRGHA